MRAFKEIAKRRLVGLLCRAAQVPRVVFYALLSNNRANGIPRRFQPVQTVGRGQITFAEDVRIGVFPSPYFFSTYAYIEARTVSASISIGSGTWINNNFCVVAEHSSISIGRNCLIGTNVEILDSDFHGLKIEERRLSKAEWAKPVRVGDNVFIGSNVKILKGVTIGNGSVIANGSLVSKDIPPGVIAGGNPAKIIGVM